MRRRIRRKPFANPELDITAFMNLMVILVPFLLITAVFSRVTVLDLFLPPATENDMAAQNKFNLEIVIHETEIIIRENASKMFKRVVRINNQFDFSKVTEALIEIKEKFPDKSEAAILSDPDVNYDTLVQVMDHVRMREVEKNNRIVLEDLFPGISIGDAPAPRGRK